MKKLLLVGAAMTAGALGLQNVSIGHGGTYRGPGDTVPPGGGGGGGGGGPATPGPAGPSTPGGTGPSTPGPGGPATPGAGPSGPANPVTGGGDSGPDLTIWQFWWGFNKDPYLNLKSHIHSTSTLTGSDDFFLGHGQQTQGKDSLKPSPEVVRQKIVPALLAALEKETNNDIVTACLIALAKIGDEKSEDGKSAFQEVITKRLADPVQEIRETAAVSLGILANPASIELLTQILEDRPEARKLLNEEAGVSFRSSAFAAYGLGLIGYNLEDVEIRKQIVATLWKACEAPRMATRDVKVGAVIAMGLVPLDVEADAPAEAGAEEVVYDPSKAAPATRQEQIRYLVTFFKDENNDNRNFLVRAHAPRSMAILVKGASPALQEEAANELLEYVGTRNKSKGEKEIRQSCTLALGQIGDLDAGGVDAKIRTALMEQLDSPDPQIKNFGLIAIGQVGGRPGTGDDPTATGAKEVREFLLRTLGRAKGGSKPWAALGIGVMERSLLDNNVAPSSESLQALRAAFDEEDSPTSVGAFAIALGITRDIDSQELLLKKLDGFSDENARGDIAVGLGLMNAAAAIEPIQEVVKKSKYKPDLLKNAAIALGLLGDKNVVTDLVNMLKDEAKTLSTQAAVASALGFIGDARSIDPLIAMLQDATLTDKARAFAGVALGIVADKEPLPWNSKVSVDLNYRATTITLTSHSDGTGILDIL